MMMRVFQGKQLEMRKNGDLYDFGAMINDAGVDTDVQAIQDLEKKVCQEA